MPVVNPVDVDQGCVGWGWHRRGIPTTFTRWCRVKSSIRTGRRSGDLPGAGVFVGGGCHASNVHAGRQAGAAGRAVPAGLPRRLRIEQARDLVICLPAGNPSKETHLSWVIEACGRLRVLIWCCGVEAKSCHGGWCRLTDSVPSMSSGDKSTTKWSHLQAISTR